MRSLEKTISNEIIKQSPEERLFKSVIAQAYQDATYQGPYRENILHKRDAIDWFEGDGRDFRLVCSIANYDSDYVFAAYQRAKKKGLVSYTDYQSRMLNKPTKPIKKDKFVLKYEYYYEEETKTS